MALLKQETLWYLPWNMWTQEPAAPVPGLMTLHYAANLVFFITETLARCVAWRGWAHGAEPNH